MELYELEEYISAIAENLEAALSWEPDTDADGMPIDADGNIIPDVEAYRADMLSAWSDTLEAAYAENDAAAGDLAVYLKNLKAMAEAIQREERKLRTRRYVYEKAIDRIADSLIGNMERTGRNKIETPQVSVSVRNNPVSTHIINEAEFIRWAQENDHDDMLKYVEPEIRRKAVKTAIEIGIDVPYAELTRTKSLIVR